ncbi:MAG TPA: response regulator, partial [Chloroflexota bacterium]
MNILIVDDEAAVRQAMQRALMVEAYSVQMASDGIEALTSIASEQPDVVILDVLMPGIDGLEVARRLRRGGNHVPILMLTAREA